MATATVAVKRLNLILSEKVYQEIHSLAQETRHSMTELVRIGLGLVKIAIEEARQGNKLIVATAEGKALREIVIPH